MHWVELICLAKSKRPGGRCVAGVVNGTLDWVRPVTAPQGGALQEADCRLDSGRSIRVLDAARIPLSAAVPSAEQPENWLIAPGTWQFLGRIAQGDIEEALSPLVNPEPQLLGGSGDSVPAGTKQRSSLALVQPTNLVWWTKLRTGRGPQQRASFELCGQPYDLPVTDPTWERKISQLGAGHHEEAKVTLANGRRIWFCVSLTEPFGGWCYKLVAAVIAF